jgi:hypothetical protein
MPNLFAPLLQFIVLPPGFNVGGAIFVSVWGAFGIGSAAWMILRPNSYWGMWKRFLKEAENASSNDWYYARQDSIRRHVATKNPKRKARIFGSVIILIVCAVEALIWRVMLYGPF